MHDLVLASAQLHQLLGALDHADAVLQKRADEGLSDRYKTLARRVLPQNYRYLMNARSTRFVKKEAKSHPWGRG